MTGCAKNILAKAGFYYLCARFINVHSHLMLSRRFLRIKVMQAVYAFQQQGPENINAGEKQLLVSLDKLYELFIHLLSLCIEMRDFSFRRIDENRMKFLPTAEDLNPNMRFVENQLFTQLSVNKDFIKRCSQYKINWVDEEEMIRKFYNQLRENEEYHAYMSRDAVSYADDKHIVVHGLLEMFAGSDLLRSYFENKSIYWSEDFDIAMMLADKAIKAFKKTADENTPLPTLLKDEKFADGSEDLAFTKILYRKTILRSDELDPVIAAKAQNWDIERIAIMDIILIKMAITEMIEFPSIPVKVTMNEYIELAKEYSSPKSKTFINGVLDNVTMEYTKSGLIKKSGRGLME